LARDHREADLEVEDRAMLDYVVKLTVTPWKVGEADVDRLRGVGFDDVAVLDICQVASYYNYVNRMADGLGVEMESNWREEDCTLSRSEFKERRRR
jgi:uncharacterized peroxidase-related enzyme